MQLGLAHCALQPKYESVVVVTGVIEAVGISDERVGQRAQVQQVIPVRVAPGETRHLLSEHEPDLAEADGGHKRLEA